MGKRLRLLGLAIFFAVFSWGFGQQEANLERTDNNFLLRRSGRHRALRVLDSSLVYRHGAGEQLLMFCEQKGVDQLFIAIPQVPPAREQRWAWRYFIREATRRGFEVYASAGGSQWASRPYLAFRHVDALAAFQRSAGPSERFQGVLYDVPLNLSLTYKQVGPEPDMEEVGAAVVPPAPKEIPPLSAEQKAELEKDHKTLEEYFTFVRRVRERLSRAALPLTFGMTIPTWLERRVLWNDEQKLAYKHLMDLVDFVVLTNLPDEAEGIVEAAAEEIAYADAIGKRLYLRLEVRNLPGQPKGATLYGEDELALEALIKQALLQYPTNPSWTGVIINDYAGYRMLPAQRLPGGRPDYRWRTTFAPG